MITRDRRGENAFGPEGRLTHERLIGWADWHRSAMQAEYGGLSTIARLMKFGAQGASHNDAPVEMPEHVAVVDLAVSTLSDLKERHVIVHIYCAEEPFEAIAKELMTSVDHVKYQLRSARGKVGSFISGWYRFKDRCGPL